MSAGAPRRCVLRAAALAAAALAAAPRASAQGSRVTVHGVVYDSLRGVPLANAFVTILGRARAATTDVRGRFRFDTLPPGTYTFSAQHDELDTLGLSGLSTRANITGESNADVVLAVPSFATFWRTACPGTPPRDSGLVYGTIRSAVSREPVRDAQVAVTWIEARAVEGRVPGVRRWRRETNSDSTGSYGVCGVPTDVAIRVRATAESLSTGLIDLLPRGVRVRRRDLLVGPEAAANIAGRGTIQGSIANASGGPVANARIITEDAPEVRSGADGRFTIRAVPAGTRQVEIQVPGMQPSVQAVDVTPGSTTSLVVQLDRVTELEVVSITERARGPLVAAFEERKRTGLGYVKDSTALRGAGTLRSVFEGFPSVIVQRVGASTIRFRLVLGQEPRACLANVFIDGVRQVDQETLIALHPTEIAAVEVYPRGLQVPAEFQVRGAECGAVAVWTKFAFGR